ncbi:hypothetical protein ABVF16_005177, partial [Salmonella enterica]
DERVRGMHVHGEDHKGGHVQRSDGAGPDWSNPAGITSDNGTGVPRWTT